MIARIAVLGILALASGCAPSSRAETGEVGSSLSGAGRCPQGHAELQVVPVLYGELKTDAATRKALAEGLFLHGGELEDGLSPRWASRCARCGYARNGTHGYWERTSDRPDGFHPPLTRWLRDIELPAGAQRSRAPRYWQAVKDGAVWESVTFGCAGFQDSSRLLARQRENLGKHELSRTDKHNARLSARRDDGVLEIALRYVPAIKEGIFSASYRRGGIHRPDADESPVARPGSFRTGAMDE